MDNIKELNTMERKELTVKDVLVDVIGVLGKISIPMDHFDEIGIPVKRAIDGLNMCVEAINNSERKADDEPDA